MAAEAAPDSMMSGSSEAQAASAIAEWDGLHRQLASSRSRHQEQLILLQEKIAEREKEATELQSQYKDMLGRFLREAVDPKTGKGIPVAKITALEQSVLLKEHAADTARFNVLYLHAKLHRLQGLQRLREHNLGLHMVDFEQLKVENAHLSDKIEDRGRQLASAQKQSHAALNVLAHVKEKHHWEKRKRAELQATLAKAQEKLQFDKERARFAVEQQLKRKTRQMKLQEAKLLQDPTLMANFQELLVVREHWTSKIVFLTEQHAATMRAP
ncbi:g11007 [Coccomyxa elongata]